MNMSKPYEHTDHSRQTSAHVRVVYSPMEALLCACISKSLNYDAFNITQGTATRTFGVSVPANTDHSIGLGYTDNQD